MIKSTFRGTNSMSFSHGCLLLADENSASFYQFPTCHLNPGVHIRKEDGQIAGDLQCAYPSS